MIAGGRRRARPRNDAGLSLIEVMVGMTIMSVFLAMFTVGILQMYSTTNRTEAIAAAQSQVNIAVSRLDIEVRYAAAISTPGCSNGNPPPCTASDPHRFVEYLSIPDAAGDQRCVQLRVTLAATGGTLRRRTWVDVDNPQIRPWISAPVLISGISSVKPGTTPPQAAPPPFTLAPVKTTVIYQRLQLQLGVASGAGATASTKQIDTTFTALNSTASMDSSQTCREGRAIA